MDTINLRAVHRRIMKQVPVTPENVVDGNLLYSALDYIEQLENALNQSVKLQSHYAVCLNETDVGHRLTFENGQAWIERLKKVGMLR